MIRSKYRQTSINFLYLPNFIIELFVSVINGICPLTVFAINSIKFLKKCLRGLKLCLWWWNFSDPLLKSKIFNSLCICFFILSHILLMFLLSKHYKAVLRQSVLLKNLIFFPGNRQAMLFIYCSLMLFT